MDDNIYTPPNATDSDFGNDVGAGNDLTPGPASKPSAINPLVIKIISIVVIIGSLLGGVYWAYSRGYIAIPFLSPNSDQLIEKFINSFSKIENAKYRLEFKALAGERNSKYYTIFETEEDKEKVEDAADILGAYGLNDVDSVFRIFPGDLDLTLGTTVYLETDAEPKNADFQWQLDGNYSGGDMTVEGDMEIRKIDDSFYGIVRKFPGVFFIDVSGIKGKWIEVTPEDNVGQTIDSAYSNVKKDEIINKITDLLQATFDSEFFKLSDQKNSEIITGVKSEHYTVAINPEALPDTYRALIDRIKDRGEDATSVEQSFDNFQKDQKNMAMLKKMVDNMNVEIWIDRTNGFVRQAKMEFFLVPPDTVESLKNKQLNLSFLVALDKINEKVKLDRPSPTIDYYEAERLLTGKSEAAQKFDRQRNLINDIRTALSNYLNGHDEFPESLPILKDSMAGLKEACEKEFEPDSNNNNLGFGLGYTHCYDYKDTLTIIDIFTDQEFGYKRENDDYRLTYRMVIPEDTNSYYSSQYTDGENTATKDDLSLETEDVPVYRPIDDLNVNSNANTNTDLNSSVNTNQNANSNTNSSLCDTCDTNQSNQDDKDGDGIKDIDEIYYETDPNERDTDGDGYDDLTEINNGYNPNGSGLLVREGDWSICIGSNEYESCIDYCETIGQICSNYGITSRKFENWGVEVFYSDTECGETGSVGGNQYKCTYEFPDREDTSRWKCFCK